MPEDKKPKMGSDEYYSANAKLMYYRDRLKDQLRKKNPEAFDKLIEERGKVVRSSKLMEAIKNADAFVEGYDYKDALTPDEIKSALGDDYEDYLGTIGSVYNSGWEVNPAKRLMGSNEADVDMSKLMFGKRFATMAVTPRYTENITRDGKQSRMDADFQYDPVKKKVNKLVTYR